MQNRENFILLGVNTIIIILVLVMLFRTQDNKIKAYLKKSEKKFDEFIKNQQILQKQQMQQMQQMQQNKINQEIMSQRNKLMNINTMQVAQQPLLNNNDDSNNNNLENQNDNNNLNNDIDSYIDPLNE